MFKKITTNLAIAKQHHPIEYDSRNNCSCMTIIWRPTVVIKQTPLKTPPSLRVQPPRTEPP